jgi:membrane protein implicated in regulation of membrane protease activity
MDQQFRFVLAQTAWMLCLVLGLALFGALTSEAFVIISFIGLLIITELTAPFAVTPRWRVRVRWTILLSLLVVSYVMIQRILEIIPPGPF